MKSYKCNLLAMAKPMQCGEAMKIIKGPQYDPETDGYIVCFPDSIQWGWISKTAFDNMIKSHAINPINTEQDGWQYIDAVLDELYAACNGMIKKWDLESEKRNQIYQTNRHINAIRKLITKITQK